MEFYADNSSLWISIFDILNIFFTFYNNYKANRLISKKLFFFEEKEDNQLNNLKRRNSLNSTKSSFPKVSIDDISGIEKKEKIYTNPVIFTQKKLIIILFRLIKS